MTVKQCKVMTWDAAVLFFGESVLNVFSPDDVDYVIWSTDKDFAIEMAERISHDGDYQMEMFQFIEKVYIAVTYHA